MLNDIYSRRILELAADIPCLGRLAEPDASATARSKLCGSTVTIDVKLDGNVVTAFAHDVRACALGQASSSIMARNIIGATIDELRDVRDVASRLLKANGAAPEGKWEDLKTAVNGIAPLCTQCHAAHRERLDDGSYRVKMGG